MLADRGLYSFRLWQIALARQRRAAAVARELESEAAGAAGAGRRVASTSCTARLLGSANSTRIA